MTYFYLANANEGVCTDTFVVNVCTFVLPTYTIIIALILNSTGQCTGQLIALDHGSKYMTMATPDNGNKKMLKLKISIFCHSSIDTYWRKHTHDLWFEHWTA